MQNIDNFSTTKILLINDIKKGDGPATSAVASLSDHPHGTAIRRRLVQNGLITTLVDYLKYEETKSYAEVLLG